MQKKIKGKRHKFTPDVVSIAVALLVSREGGWGGGVRARLLARHHAGDGQLTVTVTRMMMMTISIKVSKTQSPQLPLEPTQEYLLQHV